MPDHPPEISRRLSPFLTFTRPEWTLLRQSRPMMLSADKIEDLKSLGDRVSMEEVEQIYLPLARLLHL